MKTSEVLVEFPETFLWGAATAAYQVEGNAAGRGRSVWDMFCEKRDAVFGGHNGLVACDHCGRMSEDVKLMREIGLNSYRFSISWPRIFPEGNGPSSAEGWDFYDRLVDELNDSGIRPLVTLFHWDFPEQLHLRGGWLNPDSPKWFADYAGAVAARLGDRVNDWITHNEPQMFLALGHVAGKHAPGLRLCDRDMLLLTHHSFLAHGRAVLAVRACSPRPCRIGIAPAGFVKLPEDESAASVEVARRAMFAVPDTGHFSNAWYMDPMLLGKYPEDGVQLFGDLMPTIANGDMELISQPLDFLGINIYTGVTVRASATGGYMEVQEPPGNPCTHFGWPVRPEALRWGPRFLHERYGLPVIITENGMASHDWVGLNGRVMDPQRIDFLHRYLMELRQGMDEGADVEGYFHWSLMDNFEWNEGYKYRFGLIHVDYATGRRTLKDSAFWYAEVIRSQGASLFSTLG